MQLVKYFLPSLLILSALVIGLVQMVDNYQSKSKIAICGGVKNITYMVKNSLENKKYYISTGGDLKNTLSCMGRFLPIYKRDVAILGTLDQRFESLKKRYSINEASEIYKANLPVIITKDYIYFTDKNNLDYLVFTKPLSIKLNPIEIIVRHDPDKILYLNMSNNSNVEFLANYIDENFNSEIIELGEGEYLSFIL